MITTTQIKSIKDKIKLFTGERHLYDNSYKISNIKYLHFGKYTREFQDFSRLNDLAQKRSAHEHLLDA